MRTLTARRSFAPLALAATLLAAFVFLFAWPQPAAAHDALVESSPAEGSTVDILPGEINPPGIGRDLAVQHIEAGRLARPVRTDQRQYLAGNE